MWLLVLLLLREVYFFAFIYEGTFRNITSPNIAEDASSLAMRVSLLKFEPKVSNFPVLEAKGMASSTCATAGSLCVVPFFKGSTLN